MRTLFQRDVPVGAAATIVALVLAASVVTGREDAPPEQRSPSAAPRHEGAAAPADELDVERLKRNRIEGDTPDLFAPRPPVQPPVAATEAKPAPPPAPTAPPLPFRYLGRLVDEDRTVVFLERNQENFAVSAGDSLDGSYKVEGIGETTVQFLYLPLGTRQTLSIPPQS